VRATSTGSPRASRRDGLGPSPLHAGVVPSDQSRDFMGNPVVWPGRHREVAAHLRDAGADAILTEGGIRPVDYGNPVQVPAKPGDLLLATYLLPHNIGGNMSNVVRKTIYFRITVTRHENRWHACVTNPLLEFPAVQAVSGEARTT